MDLARNPLKAALAAGQTTFGLWCALPQGVVVEAMATVGFDWLVIDTEHAAVALPDVLSLLQAAAAGGTHAGVRAGSLDVVEIKRLLDMGAQTLVIPNILDGAEAARAVAAVRYPPQGIRGVAGLTRAGGYGQIAGYATRANAEICLILQIETVEALSRIDEIAAVDGVDVLFFGPSDLAASMGYPGQPSHPAVRAAVLEGVARVVRAGRAAGILTLDDAFMREAVAAGSRMNAVGIDVALLMGAAKNLRKTWPSTHCQPPPDDANRRPGGPL